MNKIDLSAELKGNNYPGRGIVIGKSSDGKNAIITYFIMGRSENSRNRIFVEHENGLRTKAFDESKLMDPTLVIYSPVRVIDDLTIVTNGDQTDTIYDFIMEDGTFEQALRTRTFEPDPPILTPRISGIVDGKGGYKLSILKSDNGNADSALRFFYEYVEPVCGEGHFIHTYKCDGDPVPSFEGEPKCVALGNDIDELTKSIWESLNSDNKVSLFVRFINLETKQTENRIVNRHC